MRVNNFNPFFRLTTTLINLYLDANLLRLDGADLKICIEYWAKPPKIYL